MKHRNHSKRIARFKKRYKHLAAAFAGAMILSSALLPGLPMATAHAAANPNVGNTRTTTTRTASANREGSAAGINTNAKDTPGVTSHPSLNVNETSKPVSPKVTLQPSSIEKTPTTPEVPKVSAEKTPTAPEAPKVSAEKTPTAPEAPKVSTEKTPTTPETPKVSEEKTPTAPETPKVNEDKTPTTPAVASEGGNQVKPVEPSLNPNPDTVKTPEPPKVNGDKTPTTPAVASEGGSQVNPVEPSINPNQDTVMATPKGSENKTPTGPSLPSEGGSIANPVEKSTNPNQDTVNTPLPPVKGNQSEAAPSGDAPTDYKEVLNITATAYSPGPLDNDQWGDKTHMGTTIRPGVIAVDPKVIPLGSKVYVQYPDGHGEYKVAEDTGGAIKGNRIDIAVMDRGNAKDFGIQPVKVYVVETPKDA